MFVKGTKNAVFQLWGGGTAAGRRWSNYFFDLQIIYFIVNLETKIQPSKSTISTKTNGRKIFYS